MVTGKPADLADLFARLSREPDVDAPELAAHDATDALLLETAAGLRAKGLEVPPGTLVTIGDRHGALTLGAVIALGARAVRAHQDPLLAERALARNAERLGLAGDVANLPLGPELLAGARLVLLQLPRALAELDEIAGLIARHADPAVVVLAGGRVKHMTLAMNQVLGRSFGEVRAGLAARKSRVLTARVPVPAAQRGPVRFPEWGEDPRLEFRLAAFGATFGGAALDRGSALLLETLRSDPPFAATATDPRRPGPADPRRIVDVGCGNGVLATWAARRYPEAEVIATDQSEAAVRATRLTAEAAGVAGRVAIHRADAAEAVPSGWADLIVLNPPFHTGATVHAGVAHRLIRACATALAPGGELRLVFNSHLRYRSVVERAIGTVRQLARDRTFTVLAATRNPSKKITNR